MRVSIGGLTFGHRGDGLKIVDFDAQPRLSTSRGSRPRGDGGYAGLDVIPGEVWTFTVAPEGASIAQTMAQGRRMQSLWSDPALRQPGVSTPLVYDAAHDGSPGRVVYGRPGRFSPAMPGYAPGRIVAEFELLDPLKYVAAPESRWVPFGGEDSTQTVTVGGDAPTPALIRFYGPVTDPKAQIGGQEVGLVATIPEDVFVTIDSRDGRVARSDGLPMAGALTRWTRLDYLRVSPGERVVSASAANADDGSGAHFEWRDATWGL